MKCGSGWIALALACNGCGGAAATVDPEFTPDAGEHISPPTPHAAPVVKVPAPLHDQARCTSIAWSDEPLIRSGGVGVYDSGVATTAIDGSVVLDGGTRWRDPEGHLFRFGYNHGSNQTQTLLADGYRVLAAGGGAWGEASSYACIFDVRSPSLGCVTETRMKGARQSASATLLGDGRVLMFGVWGGAAGLDASPMVEVFDPEAHTWTAIETPEALVPVGNYPRQAQLATRPNGNALFFSGRYTYEFDIATNTVSLILSLPTETDVNSVAALGDDRYLYYGIGGPFGPKPSTLELDAASMTLGRPVRVNFDRGWSVAVKLECGSLLAIDPTTREAAFYDGEVHGWRVGLPLPESLANDFSLARVASAGPGERFLAAFGRMSETIDGGINHALYLHAW